jgi:hypothetical protein
MHRLPEFLIGALLLFSLSLNAVFIAACIRLWQQGVFKS